MQTLVAKSKGPLAAHSAWWAAFLLAVLWVGGVGKARGAETLTTPLLPNAGFEAAAAQSADHAEGWNVFGQGYTRDASEHHGGAFSLRCANGAATDAIAGASCTLTLNQTRAEPILLSGWSKAVDAGGTRDSDYSLYVDAEYADGTPLYGVNAPFATGTHDWQRVHFTLRPAKPLRVVTVYLLFRKHSGTVWFDDIAAETLSHPFDSQPLVAPTLPAGMRSGWFARDVAANGPILPLPALNLTLHGESSRDSQIQRVTVANPAENWRAITVYYVERVPFARDTSLHWWNDINQSVAVGGADDAANLVAVPEQGAIGEMSLYPFGCVTGSRRGQALGVPPDLGPRIQRIGYQAESGLLYVAFDVAVPPRRLAASRPAVGVAVASYAVDSAWGFRSAAATYYRLFPEAFTRRATAEGIWMPFSDPAKIPQVADFGFAYHEGDNSVATDDRLGILSLTYAEPMTYWQVLAPAIPRTYDAALAELRRDAAGTDPAKRRAAQTVLLSGSEDAEGRFNVQFRNEPWANGAVWTLNPNPRLPHGADEWTKARLNYSAEEQARFDPGAKGGTLDGEYLDSLEGWADVLDFRPESLAHTTLPLTFASDTFAPTLPTWFSVYEYTAYLSRDLHARKKLLFANTALARFQAFGPLLDVMGIETVWGTSEHFTPDDDAIFAFRRTLCYHKPYLLLQNNDFDKFGSDAVERYFQRCLFYGVYPSMFSVNAADHPYWENPKWYERDRPLFQKYIPLIQHLSAMGWEPITEAHASDPAVHVERYGVRDWTLLNTGKADCLVTVVLERRWGGKAPMVREGITGETLQSQRNGEGKLTVTVSIPAGVTRVLQL